MRITLTDNFMYIFFFAVLIILGILWLYKEFSDIKEYNKKLFIRSYKHEQFLMSIYGDVPKPIQDKIEKYLNSIVPL